jgi:hypothetical protein
MSAIIGVCEMGNSVIAKSQTWAKFGRKWRLFEPSPDLAVIVTPGIYEVCGGLAWFVIGEVAEIESASLEEKRNAVIMEPKQLQNTTHMTALYF